MNKRGFGEGTIDERRDGVWRIRYRIGSKRFSRTIFGTRTEAAKLLRQLQHAGDTGEHVAPDKLTLRTWAEHWLSIGCPGKRRKAIGVRAQERYAGLMRLHVLPALGDRPLQELTAIEIGDLYERLAPTMAPSSLLYLHVVLGSCLAAAVSTRKISRNPMLELAKVPTQARGVQHGTALEAGQLRSLIEGFKGSPIYTIVAVAAFTGARRGEILALRWTDLDVAAKTLRIDRAVDHTKAHGLRLKDPKSARGKRTIAIDDELIALLLAERDRHLRIMAGVPDGATVDLSLVRLPSDALIFPRPPGYHESFSFTALHTPANVTRVFDRAVPGLGFPELRFHDLRGTHATLLLDAGIPAHVVAERLGHDTATLWSNYAKRTGTADTAAASIIGNQLKGALT